MTFSSTKRAVAVVALSFSLFAGAATSAAMATPADEAKYLARFKSSWASASKADKASICNGYKASHTLMISETTAELWKNPNARKALSKPALKRVVAKYLAWACPNDRPRP